jgi:hypothetical protein
VPGATPIYGLPYWILGDQPHGPNLSEALATATETAVAARAAEIAAINASLLGYKRCLGGARLTANTAAFNAETLILSTGAIALPANTAIEVEFTLNLNLTVGTDELDVRFRDNNIAGTVRKEIIRLPQRASVPLQETFSNYYETTTAESKTWAITVARFSGTGNIVAESGTRVRVYADGSSSLLTETP